MRRRGEILLKALEMFEEVVYTTADFTRAFLSSTKSDYRPLHNFVPEPHKTIAGDIKRNMALKEMEAREKQKVYNLISYLRKDGLIKMIKTGGESSWKITAKGEGKKENIKSQLSLLIPSRKYIPARSKETLIVSFDVPEKERRKRELLRTCLKNLGLKMLHKSVWMGRVRLPENFIDDLREYNLIPCLQIFSVTKTGTLKQLV